MKIIDISMKIEPNMTVYKNKSEKQPAFNVLQNIEDNHPHESSIAIGMHTGTHMDAPLHMIKGGKTIDQMDLSKLIAPCKVFDYTDIDGCITKEDLKIKDINQGDFIILKTKNSLVDKFDFNFVFLEKSGAEYLRDKRINGVGIDALGIERSQPDHETHIALLGSDIAILEGLMLKNVSEGEYFLIAAPINISNAEAAPVRALLLDNNPFF